jgi:hypothetical protein
MDPITKRFYLTNSSARLSVCMPRHVFDRVMALSTYQGRSASNLCAFLIERSLETLPDPLRNLS